MISTKNKLLRPLRFFEAKVAAAFARRYTMLQLVTLLCCGPALLATSTALCQVTSLPKDLADSNSNVKSQLFEAPAEPTTVYARGTSRIYGGDVASARSAALQAAYAEAVASGTGVAVESLTLVKNVREITDIITTRSRGVVKSYDVLSEDIEQRTDGNFLTVSIDATVAPHPTNTDAEDALELFLQVIGDPEILILVAQLDAVTPATAVVSEAEIQSEPDGRRITARARQEVTGSERYGPSPQSQLSAMNLQATEAAIAAKLNDAGYRTLTLDMPSVHRNVSRDLLHRARSGETAAALEIARNAGAAALIVGSLSVANRTIRPQGVEFEQATGEFAARSFLTSTGEEVRTLYESATSAHSNLLAAISNLKIEIADRISNKLKWEIPRIISHSPQVTTVTVEATNTATFLEVTGALQTHAAADRVLIDRIPSAGSPGVIKIHRSVIPAHPTEIMTLLTDHVSRNLNYTMNSMFDLHVIVE